MELNKDYPYGFGQQLQQETEFRQFPQFPGGSPGGGQFPGGGPFGGGQFPGGGATPGQFPGGGPFPGGGFPGGGASPGGDQYGPPPGPPPASVPQESFSATALAVDPGAIRRCRFRFTYIWLNNGNSFWFYPTFIGRTSVAGWRWRRIGWTYYGTDLRRIRSFTCF